MEEKDKSQLVQMRLQPQTLKKVEHLMELTGRKNRTQIITSALDLTEELVSSVKKGARVVIENPDGTKDVIKFIGV